MRAKKQLGPDDTLQRIWPLYKRKCDNSGIISDPALRSLADQAAESNKLDQVKIASAIGPTHMRNLMQTLLDIGWTRIRHFIIWKAGIGDEGLRNICRYVDRQENVVEVLDVMENEVTQLGCEFLGKTLALPGTRIQHLKLDNNPIGSRGLEALTVGLRDNPHLTKLSLKYCQIDEKGVKHIQLILASIKTRIRSIKLQGNKLGNQGVLQFLKVVELNEMLEKINIADTGLNLLDFKAKNMYTIDEGQGQGQKEQEEEQQEDQQNPERTQVPDPSIQQNKNALVSEEPAFSLKTLGKIKQKFKKKQEPKISRSIPENDDSISGHIMRLLSSIMRQNLMIRKYDIRFNPISDDAAFILFEIIEQNAQIKDVQINNNVDNQLREDLDTLMRKRTGRLPKGRGRAGKLAKSKKKR